MASQMLCRSGTSAGLEKKKQLVGIGSAASRKAVKVQSLKVTEKKPISLEKKEANEKMDLWHRRLAYGNTGTAMSTNSTS